MKIGILTYWSSNDNYGQLLQCFALQQYLKDQGHEPILVKYAPSESKFSMLCNKLCGLLSDFHIKLFLGKIAYYFSKERKDEQKLWIMNSEYNIARAFDAFRDKYIDSTHNIYHSIDELRNNPPEVDVLICGSDQVWHDSLKCANTKGWFLQFGDKAICRISYAASIGRNLSAEDQIIIKNYLQSFNAISVREYGVKELFDKIGITCMVTLDPTLLLSYHRYDELFSIEQRKINENYCFFYVLNVRKSEEIHWNILKDYLANQRLEAKIVCSSGYYPARKLLDDIPNIYATVIEWLSLIKFSKSVVTTSFHGMVFSVIMHKPFLVILLKGQHSAANGRLISFLHNVGLSDRILNPSKDIFMQMNAPIDWNMVDEKLNVSKKQYFGKKLPH